MFNFLHKKQKEKPILHYVEAPIVAHCNLKCNYCNVFCNYIDEEYFVSFEDFKNDIWALSERIKIRKFRIVGGETLLHPEINKFMIEARKALPDYRVSILTNAILLPSMDEEFWKILKEYDIELDISYYNIWKKEFSSIVNLIKEHDIQNVEVENKLYFFDPINPKGDSDMKKAYDNCKCKGPTLWNHELYPCKNAFTSFYNKKFNMNIDLPPAMDVYKVSGQTIYNKLVKHPKPFKACCYCYEKDINHRWSKSKQA